VLALLAAGCATPPMAIPVGAPQREVSARLGTPSSVYPPATPSTGARWEYDTGRWGQKTWMVDFGADDRVVAVSQAMTMHHFFEIRTGVDDMAAIRREFGNPVRIVAYPMAGLTSWEYPYKENPISNSLMSVEFDAAGLVRRVESGPDPLFDVDGGGRGRK